MRTMNEELSLDPQMRGLYKLLPLFLTTRGPRQSCKDEKPFFFCLSGLSEKRTLSTRMGPQF